jgi:hypothetical protein
MNLQTFFANFAVFTDAPVGIAKLRESPRRPWSEKVAIHCGYARPSLRSPPEIGRD